MNTPKQICLEKDFIHGDVKSMYKIDLEHYTKVLQAKFDRGILNFETNLHVPIPKHLVKLGDFIKIYVRKSHGAGTYYYGFVQKDDAGYFIRSGYLFGNDTHWSYCQRKIYLHGKAVIFKEIVWGKTYPTNFDIDKIYLEVKEKFHSTLKQLSA